MYRRGWRQVLLSAGTLICVLRHRCVLVDPVDHLKAGSMLWIPGGDCNGEEARRRLRKLLSYVVVLLCVIVIACLCCLGQLVLLCVFIM